MTTVQALTRRKFLRHCAASAAAVAAAPALAQTTAERQFRPQSGTWRCFEVTTRVDLPPGLGASRVWLPVPSLDSEWQQSMESVFSSNGSARLTADGQYGARMLQVAFSERQEMPFVELTSRVRTQDRAVDWTQRGPVREDAATLQAWTRPTRLLPTHGLVRATALEVSKGATSDVEKVRRLYDWIVANTYREPKVRGCGEGDILAMLETGNLGGKCADINALFVGLCRSVGIPARDVYGVRLAPSAFGYRELGGNSASLKGAQHCRAEVFLNAHGWVAMDPADVAKVMRQETPEWIRSTRNPVVAPVNKALFGGWEGNWMAFNNAHDLALPNAKGARLGFFMYPTAESAAGRLDSYAPDDFRYQVSAREIKA